MSAVLPEIRPRSPSRNSLASAPYSGGGDRYFPTVRACPETHVGRERLEQYISGIFTAAYGARILEYLPLLFQLECDGSEQAALGLRGAGVAPLFCEQYLDAPAQQQVETLYNARVSRTRIMELGNLVATEPGNSGLLYIIITAAIHEAGVEYLMFAANKRVRNSIARCGFTPKVIQGAQRSRLGPQGLDWGRYYEGDPIVMLADIALTMRQISAQPALQQIIEAYQYFIPALADSIRIHLRSSVR